MPVRPQRSHRTLLRVGPGPYIIHVLRSKQRRIQRFWHHVERAVDPSPINPDSVVSVGLVRNYGLHIGHILPVFGLVHVICGVLKNFEGLEDRGQRGPEGPGQFVSDQADGALDPRVVPLPIGGPVTAPVVAPSPRRLNHVPHFAGIRIEINLEGGPLDSQSDSVKVVVSVCSAETREDFEESASLAIGSELENDFVNDQMISNDSNDPCVERTLHLPRKFSSPLVSVEQGRHVSGLVSRVDLQNRVKSNVFRASHVFSVLPPEAPHNAVVGLSDRSEALGQELIVCSKGRLIGSGCRVEHSGETRGGPIFQMLNPVVQF